MCKHDGSLRSSNSTIIWNNKSVEVEKSPFMCYWIILKVAVTLLFVPAEQRSAWQFCWKNHTNNCIPQTSPTRCECVIQVSANRNSLPLAWSSAAYARPHIYLSTYHSGSVHNGRFWSPRCWNERTSPRAPRRRAKILPRPSGSRRMLPSSGSPACHVTQLLCSHAQSCVPSGCVTHTWVALNEQTAVWRWWQEIPNNERNGVCHVGSLHYTHLCYGNDKWINYSLKQWMTPV